MCFKQNLTHIDSNVKWQMRTPDVLADALIIPLFEEAYFSLLSLFSEWIHVLSPQPFRGGKSELCFFSISQFVLVLGLEREIFKCLVMCGIRGKCVK